MIQFGKNGTEFVLISQNQGIQISLSRQDAKDFCRFLMLNLNIVDATLNDGRSLFEIDTKFRNEILKLKGLENAKTEGN